MIRGAALTLATGLLALFLVGYREGVASGLVWFTAIAMFASFILAAEPVRENPGNRLLLLVVPGFLSAGLLALWIVGLALGTHIWFAWFDLAFACAYGGLTVGLAIETSPAHRHRTRTA